MNTESVYVLMHEKVGYGEASLVHLYGSIDSAITEAKRLAEETLSQYQAFADTIETKADINEEKTGASVSLIGKDDHYLHVWSVEPMEVFP